MSLILTSLQEHYKISRDAEIAAACDSRRSDLVGTSD